MIIKYFDLNKLDFNKNKIILLHGKNDGLKNEEVQKLQSKMNLKY